MELFFNCEEYKKMKVQEEKTTFKLIGDYYIHNGERLEKKPPSSIAEYYKNKKITVEYVEQQTTRKGTTISTTKEITKNFYQIWSEDPDMKEYKGVVFNCDLEAVKPIQYNLFEGFVHLDSVPKKPIDLSPVFEHMRSLVDYNEEHFKYVISWFAQLIQQPHILPHTTLIFISDEGVGKDLFHRFISKVINPDYTMNTEKLESICGKFNSALGGKLLITVNETNPVESRERIENLKQIITADEVMIEGKHKDPIKTPNYCRFVFFSNRLFAFPVESGARRPKIFKSSSKYLPDNYGIEENKKYFTNLSDNIYKNKDYQKAFLEYLKAYDISKFNPKEMIKSELHQELEDCSVCPIVHYLANVVKNNKSTFRLLTSQAYTEYCEFVKANHYKFEMNHTKFTVEMVSTYKIKKIKSSNNFFEFNIEDIKAMLIKKYKYIFDEKEVEISPLDNGLEPEPDYKKLYLELLAKQEVKKPIEPVCEEVIQPKQEVKINKSVVKVPAVEIPDSDDEEQELSEQEQLKLLEQELEKYF